LRVFGQELCVAGLEGIRDVFEEDEAEHDVFVVARLHVAAQLVGAFEELGLEAKVDGVAVVGFYFFAICLLTAGLEAGFSSLKL